MIAPSSGMYIGPLAVKRRTGANVRFLAADADLKGPDWDGYGLEKSGQTAALARLRDLQDELETLIDGTAGEQEL